MVMVGAGDHDRVDPVQLQQLAVVDALPGVPTEPLAHLGVGFFPRDLPGVADGDDLKISRREMLVDALHVGGTPPFSAADDADPDPIVGPDGASGGGGRERRTSA